MNTNQHIKNLPPNWKWVKLGEVCDKLSLNKIKIKQKDYLEVGKYPVVDQGQDLIGGYFNDENLLIPNDPPYIVFGDHTKVKKYIEFKFVAGADGVKVLKTKPAINPKFLFYSLHTIKIEDKGYARHFQLLEKELLPLPPLHTQQAIVAKIETLFTELDNGIAQLKAAQQQLKTYRQAVLKYAFEGKLTNTNVKEGELPKGWEMVQIKEVAVTIGGYAFKSNEFETSGKYQVLRMGNVRPGLLRFEESPVFLNEINNDVLERSLLQINDVIITQTGTRKKRDYGFMALISSSNLLLNQRIASIRFSKKYLPNFFLYFSWTDKFKDQFFANETGNVGQGNVGMKAITETFIPLPPLEEQQLIVQAIESRLSVATAMEQSITQSLQQAEALRQSILRKAFEGRLVVEDNLAKVIPLERKVLAGRIIQLFNDDKHFGLTKFQKTLCLVEHYIEVEYEMNYGQLTAGPYDRDFTLAFRSEMKEKDWFQEESKISMTHFIVGENVTNLTKNYPIYFREKGAKISFILKLLKDKNLFESELIATLYAVWNNRIIKKEKITIELLMADIYAWSNEKIKYSKEDITKMYAWMQEVKLEPRGFGKVIGN